METKPKIQVPLSAVIALIVGIGIGMFLGSMKPGNKEPSVVASSIPSPPPAVTSAEATATPSPPAQATTATSAPAEATATSGNVKVEEYMETIEISAKGGYDPKVSIAKANLPAVIKINTDSTYDCSASVVIPSLNYHTRLPFTGSASIDLPPQQPDTELTGTCGMGMYSFKIKFAG